MDVRNAEHVLGVEVAEIDLNELSVGQTVEVATNKGTFWVTRTDSSVFHGGDHHDHRFGAESVAVWGTDLTAGNPMTSHTTRGLKKGGKFSVTNERNDQAIDSVIEHILLPVKPDRMVHHSGMR